MPAPATPPYRRRRLTALGVLVAVVGAIALVVAGTLGSGEARDPARADADVQVPPAGSREAPPDRAGAAQDPAGPRRDMGAPGPPRPVPVLMYHVVNDPPADAPYPDLYVPRNEFADQVRALADAGYTAVTLRELWAAWHEGGPLPDRAIVFTFDDGYRSHVTNALPVLRERGWPGVLFLELRNIGVEHGLTGAQVRALLDAGWELGSHTIDHPDLTTVGAAALEREVGESRVRLRRRFGVPVDFFCYPAGRYDAAAIAAVERAGYLAATTVEPGLARPDESARFELSRVRVNNGVGGAALLAQVEALGSAPSS